MGKIKNLSIIILQIAALFFISLAMNYIAKWLHLPIPGTILGIIVLFILLKTKVIKLSWIEQGANWLLAELLLFFIPAAVGVMNYMSLLERDGIRILLVVISSTIVVMASSGLVASRISKRKEQRVQ
ncbi:CidA/LrgA family holin-like protein [Paenibacillus motobuensis]|jgi:holin-like protein|uniref:CidA/LrgA family holin-like protein n=1 Tax=Paenibacillus motobuensis TaxID=295324 RepID=A0ABN0YMT0_9BACL